MSQLESLQKVLRLGQTPARILDLILNDQIVGYSVIAQRVYGQPPEAWLHLVPRIKVHVVKIRHRLDKYSIIIDTARSSGYSMSGNNKQRLRAILEGNG